MILNKRIPRELIENKVKYLGIIIMIVIASIAIVGFTDSIDSIFYTAHDYLETSNCEDGNFLLKNKLDNITLKKLNNLGVDVEECFYSDCKINDTLTLRVYKERNSINKSMIVDGSSIKSPKEILVSDKIGEFEGYRTGDIVTISEKEYKIVGHTILPDYNNMKKEVSDMSNDPKQFAVAIVGDEDFKDMKSKKYSYSFKRNGASYEDIRSILQNNTQLNSFIKTEDNSRIIGYKDDLQGSKNAGFFMGLLLCGLVGFVISMMIISIIDKESSIIGALYSLGYIKKELVRHFMTLPTVLVTIGAVLGTVIGFIVQGSLGKLMAGTYAFPEIKTSYSFYIIFLGILLPIIIVVIVNYFMLSKHLNRTPLQLLRNEKKQGKLRTFKVRGFSFMTRFKITQIVRELGSSIMLFAGVYFSLFMLIAALSMYSSMDSFVEATKKDCKINYTYMLKMPIDINEGKNAEKAYIKGMEVYFKDLDKNMNVTLEGIRKDSSFFDFKIDDNNNGAYVSNTFAKKFNVKAGDYINLKDTEENKFYKVKVKGEVNYNVGLYVFMNIKQMSQLINDNNTTHNALLSNNKLNINDDYVLTTIKAEDAIKGAETAANIMSSMEIGVIMVSVIMFVLITSLLLKLIIDKSMTGISLIKVFGYNRKEISKLYIGSALYTIVICLIIGIPTLILLFKEIWPSLMATMESYIFMDVKWYYYIIMIAIALLSYFISTILLKKHIDKISLSEALKERN